MHVFFKIQLHVPKYFGTNRVTGYRVEKQPSDMFCKKNFLKLRNIHRKTPVLESLFKKIALNCFEEHLPTAASEGTNSRIKTTLQKSRQFTSWKNENFFGLQFSNFDDSQKKFSTLNKCETSRKFCQKKLRQTIPSTESLKLWEMGKKTFYLSWKLHSDLITIYSVFSFKNFKLIETTLWILHYFVLLKITELPLKNQSKVQ